MIVTGALLRKPERGRGARGSEICRLVVMRNEVRYEIAFAGRIGVSFG